MTRYLFSIKKLIFVLTNLCLSLGELRGEGMLLSRKEMYQVRGSFLYMTLIVSGTLTLLSTKIREIDEEIRLYFKSDDLVLDSQKKKIEDLNREVVFLHKTKRTLKRILNTKSNLLNTT